MILSSNKTILVVYPFRFEHGGQKKKNYMKAMVLDTKLIQNMHTLQGVVEKG